MPGPLTAADLERLVALYEQAELYLLERIARRLERGVTFEGWTERKYAETLAMRREIEVTLSRVRAGAQVTVDQLISDAFREGATSAAYQLASAGVSGQLARTNTSALRALLAQTQESLSAAERAVLRTTMDAYRDTIAQTTLQVVAGQGTRAKALQDALNKLAARGITGFIDRTGRAWDLTAYVDMATRTASGRAFLEGKLKTFRNANISLFIVSFSGSPCELCAPWEGQVVSDGPSADYPSIDELYDSGWGHPNCGHTLDAYTEGIGDELLGLG